MPDYASWIHGSAAHIGGRGDPRRIVVGAEGIALEDEERNNWHFTFAVPTPVFVGGQRVRATQAMVLFEGPARVDLTSLAVTDGKTERFRRDDLRVGGDFSNRLKRDANAFPFGEAAFSVDWGISLVARFTWYSRGRLTVIGAGVDFDLPA